MTDIKTPLSSGKRIQSDELRRTMIHGSADDQEEFWRRHDITYWENAVLEEDRNSALVAAVPFDTDSVPTLKDKASFQIVLGIMEMFPDVHYYLYCSPFEDVVKFYACKNP